MNTYYITYLSRQGKKFTVWAHGFDKAQDTVATIMNTGGTVLGIKEEDC